MLNKWYVKNQGMHFPFVFSMRAFFSRGGGHFSRGVHTEALGYKRSLEGGGELMLLPLSSPLDVSWEMMGMNHFTLPCLIV